MTYYKVPSKGEKTDLKFPMGEGFVCISAAMTAVSWDDKK